MVSPASATARTSVFWTPGLTGAMKERTVVRPSSWVFRPKPLFGALSRKNAQFWHGPEPALPPDMKPLLTLFIDTGVVVPGSRAKLVPLTKNPKTSLNELLTHPLNPLIRTHN